MTNRTWSKEEQEIVDQFVLAEITGSRGDALRCIRLFEQYNIDHIVAGGTATYDDEEVLLPDYLHEGTARERFEHLGIL